MFLPYLQIDKSSRLYSNIHTDLNCECEVNTFTGNFKTQRIVFFRFIVWGRGTYSFILNLVAKINATDRANSMKSSVLILITNVCAICLLHTLSVIAANQPRAANE